MEEELDGLRSAPSSPDGSKDKNSDAATNDVGYTFDELVDRLVSQPVSRQDSKFASIFLCLYRKFAAPAQLLNALVKRFDRNEKNNTDQLSRIADQLQLLNVMAQWVSEYPGDLAHPRTRKRIVDFVSTLERSHFYMFAAKEVSSYLEIQAEDDDIGWPFSDGDIEEYSISDTPLVSSGRNSPSTFLGGPVTPVPQEEEEEEEDPIYNLSAVDLSEGLVDPSMTLSGPPSSSSLVEKPGSIVSQSFTLLSTEAAQKESQHLELTPTIPISKFVWRQFMEFPDEDVARELTRLDWIMFNSFRPRDLVRHVSISGPDKDKIKSLQHVNRMIKQFNHLAFFVASMILLRDKPKHRARALERFMNIALVRYLYCVSLINTNWPETAPPEQLQFSGSTDSRNQRDTGATTLTNPRTGPCSGTKRFHEAGYPHGNPEESLCLSTGMGQFILRTNPVPSTTPSRPRFCRRGKQDFHRRG